MSTLRRGERPWVSGFKHNSLQHPGISPMNWLTSRGGSSFRLSAIQAAKGIIKFKARRPSKPLVRGPTSPLLATGNASYSFCGTASRAASQ